MDDSGETEQMTRCVHYSAHVISLVLSGRHIPTNHSHHEGKQADRGMQTVISHKFKLTERDSS